MTSRRTIAKLQRDLARLKSERTHNQVRSRAPCCPPCRTHHPHPRLSVSHPSTPVLTPLSQPLSVVDPNC